MKKIDRIKEANGDLMIRVWECDNFERVADDIPIYISEKIKKGNLHNSGNVRILIIRDIIKPEE